MCRRFLLRRSKEKEMSVSIEISDVIKKYQDNTVIKGLSLSIKPGEFFTLLGPSVNTLNSIKNKFNNKIQTQIV